MPSCFNHFKWTGIKVRDLDLVPDCLEVSEGMALAVVLPVTRKKNLVSLL